MRYNSLCELMIYTLKRGDIPSLSAWIKKSRSVERDFLSFVSEKELVKKPRFSSFFLKYRFDFTDYT